MDDTRTDSERIAELEKKVVDLGTVFAALLGSFRELAERQESCRKNIEILQGAELQRQSRGRRTPDLN